ncbi:MAG: ABC transporter substrate-binding protein [Thermomicrobia bacterium]|nr:ABC transporter substrate-binding protein [Thermomicrobia bacterium]
MSYDASNPLDLVEALRGATPAQRREFSRRAALLGMSGSVVAGLLAACGGSSTAPTNTPAGGTQAAPTKGTIPTVAVNQSTAPASSAASTSGTAPAASAATGGSPTTSAASASGKKPKRGGTFITMGHQDVSSLSPDDAGPTVWYVLIYNIHEALLKVDENYKLVPVLAESYQISPDGKTWTFKLRAGVKWHDGQPFTSADVKYYYDYLRDPKNAAISQPNFKDVANVDAPDPSTVVVTLQRVYVPFGALSATIGIVPQHVHSKIGEKEYKKAPVGTGPYKFMEQKLGDHVTLQAFDDYWGGRPWIDFWRENIVPETSVRAIALQTGDADSSTWPIAPEDTLKFIADPKFQTFRAPGVAVNHFPLNTEKPFFTDKRVRQAMMYAMDRDAMVKDLLKGLAVKATGNLSPALEFYYEPNTTPYPHDVAKAKALLKDAGWTPGADGILVNAQGQKFSVVCTVFSALYADNTNNWARWKNPDAQKLLQEGAAELDSEKRKKIYSDLQKLISEEVPFLYVMYWETVLFFNKRIKGMPDKATNPYWLYQNFAKYWIEEQ